MTGRLNMGPYTWWNNPYPNDDPYGFVPECPHCDDSGCPECCETCPIEMEDLEEMSGEP